jgi:putative transposase
MARPYSIDLRERVVAAVVEGGLSRRQAAERFGVGISTVIRWVSQFYDTGSVAPGKMGGHRPRTISGAHHDWLVARCREREFTLRGLVAELAERGCHVDYRSVWNFVHGEGLSYKKKPWWPANATGPTWHAGGRSGRCIRAASLLSVWCSSTRPGPRPTWYRFAAGR